MEIEKWRKVDLLILKVLKGYCKFSNILNSNILFDLISISEKLTLHHDFPDFSISAELLLSIMFEVCSTIYNKILNICDLPVTKDLILNFFQKNI